MTIKKRLAVSNIIMIIVPVVITMLIGAASVGAVYFSLHNSNGFGFGSSEDFYDLSQSISAGVEEALEGSNESIKSRLDVVCSALNSDTTAVEILKDGEQFYSYGKENKADGDLIKSVDKLGDYGFASSEKRQVFHRTAQQKSGLYEIYLFGEPSHTNYTAVKATVIICAVLIAAGIIASIAFTNRFLIRFVFKKIENPLDQLAEGVKQIANGNLDYRINYTKSDEFKPICENFNDMAIRLTESVELTKRNEESRKKLFLNISHDLRSPLTSIQAYVEGLLDGVATDDAAKRKYLETIKRKTVDIDNMVSRLFEYSKLDAQAVQTRAEKTELLAELKDIINAVGGEYEEKGLKITVGGEAAYAEIYPDIFCRIVSNLLENTLKYKNSDNAKMRILTKLNGGCAEILFADNGPGVDEKDIDRIFDVFYRSDSARNNPGANGSGIGLAFVKSSVENMNGSIRAFNDNGLTVEIKLPAVN